MDRLFLMFRVQVSSVDWLAGCLGGGGGGGDHVVLVWFGVSLIACFSIPLKTTEDFRSLDITLSPDTSQFNSRSTFIVAVYDC